MGLSALWERASFISGLSVYHESSWVSELFLYRVSLGLVCGKKRDVYVNDYDTGHNKISD